MAILPDIWTFALTRMTPERSQHLGVRRRSNAVRSSAVDRHENSLTKVPLICLLARRQAVDLHEKSLYGGRSDRQNADADARIERYLNFLT
jgi:hypothetical protein